MQPIQHTIPRFGRTERAAHWLVAATVTIMLATGAGAGDDGGPLLVAHVCAAVTLVAGLALLALAGDRSALGQIVRDAARIDESDRAWLARKRPFGSDLAAPPAGHLNAGQKLAVRAVGTLLALDLASGALLLIGVSVGAVHAAAAFALAIVIAGHVFMAVANPATRPALRGMFSGHVDRARAEGHHGRWVEDLDRASPEPQSAPPAPRLPLHAR